MTITSLADYSDIIDPFIDLLLEDGGNKYSLGPDNELGKSDIWDIDNIYVMAMRAIFDGEVLKFANEVHPDFKGKGENYMLDRDAWLNSPKSWQGTRIHRHWEPFLNPSDIGDIITVFYPKVSSDIGMNNGHFELYEEGIDGTDFVWLPDNLTPIYTFIPKTYDLLIMTTDTWHKAHPFKGERYSLATDVKLIKP